MARSTVLLTVSFLIALATRSVDGRLSQSPQDYLEPSVQRHVGVLPREVCKLLIDLGENDGFLVHEESIDGREQDNPDHKYIPSQTIDVYDRTGDEVVIDSPAIWELLEPWLPKITQIVKDNRNYEEFRKLYPKNPQREPRLDWIFFRKYSPRDARNALKIHQDDNVNTVNIEMSNDFQGGGLFYVRPLASTGEMNETYDVEGYQQINSVKRENTTEFVFPNLEAGDAVFYNYTVPHGVAPIESGTRYSMAFFFDMDNPAVYEDDSDDGDELEVGEFTITLHNDLIGINLDIFLIHEGDDTFKEKESMYTEVSPNDEVDYISLEGDILQVVISGTSQVVSEIHASQDRLSHSISMRDLNSLSIDIIKASWESGYKANELEEEEEEDEELKVKLSNRLDNSVDILLVYDGAERMTVRERVFGGVYPNETTVYEGDAGDVLHAVDTRTGEFISKIEIEYGQSLYTLSSEL